LGYIAVGAVGYIAVTVHLLHRRAVRRRVLATTQSDNAREQAVAAVVVEVEAQAAARAQARVVQVLDHLVASKARAAALNGEIGLLRCQESLMEAAARGLALRWERDILSLERRLLLVKEARQVERERGFLQYTIRYVRPVGKGLVCNKKDLHVMI
jgi:hypothetical protein